MQSISVSVVVSFFICWLPFHIQRLLSLFITYHDGNVSPAVETLFSLVYYISGECHEVLSYHRGLIVFLSRLLLLLKLCHQPDPVQPVLGKVPKGLLSHDSRRQDHEKDPSTLAAQSKWTVSVSTLCGYRANGRVEFNRAPISGDSSRTRRPSRLRKCPTHRMKKSIDSALVS